MINGQYKHMYQNSRCYYDENWQQIKIHFQIQTTYTTTAPIILSSRQLITGYLYSDSNNPRTNSCLMIRSINVNTILLLDRFNNNATNMCELQYIPHLLHHDI